MGESIFSNISKDFLVNGEKLIYTGTYNSGWDSTVYLPNGITNSIASMYKGVRVRFTGSVTSVNPTQYYGTHMPHVRPAGCYDGNALFAGDAYTTKVVTLDVMGVALFTPYQGGDYKSISWGISVFGLNESYYMTTLSMDNVAGLYCTGDGYASASNITYSVWVF